MIAGPCVSATWDPACRNVGPSATADGTVGVRPPLTEGRQEKERNQLGLGKTRTTAPGVAGADRPALVDPASQWWDPERMKSAERDEPPWWDLRCTSVQLRPGR